MCKESGGVWCVRRVEVCSEWRWTRLYGKWRCVVCEESGQSGQRCVVCEESVLCEE